jgi:hypothetical protein
MKRKNVIFLFMQLLIIFMVMAVSGKSASVHHLLIEAESFTDKGGWVTDAQFVVQMGSPYLLAHGMGKPVENARTNIEFPSAGSYHVWVRTMNWVPGKWKAPGRFKLLVNGKELESELGTLDGWNWQYAGMVEVNSLKATLGLHDLTGFDGRCDAVYFNKENIPPPSDAENLAVWRKKMERDLQKITSTENFDFVIVGGGIAGCAAAMAAAGQGLHVALIQDRPILGGNASSEIRVHTEGITGFSDSILSMLNTVHWPNGSPLAKEDDIKRHSNMEKNKNIRLYLNFKAFSVKTRGNTIVSVDARHTSSGEIIRLKAPFFADCTGDGWIGYWAGAEYMYGREDSAQFNESWEKHGQLWSPAKADKRVMGASLLWRSRSAETPVPFPEVPWAMDIAKNYTAVNGEWQWEFSDDKLHQIEDAEKIRDHLLRAIYGSFYNAKKEASSNSLELEWVGYLTGKRESRRLVGDHIYTFNDIKSGIKFPDAVAIEKRSVDVHYQRILEDPGMVDFISEALFYKTDLYYIPYRTLYSRNISNLFMAGRCFSASHVGLGGPRVMNTTGQMGVAVGYAASLCKKYRTDPRGVYNKQISELQTLIGVK